MIKKIRLQKFMSVENATLELGGINVFIGPTDSGKSVIMRAINAVTSNTYPAVRYAEHGSNKYAIAIVTDSGVVQLVKSKTTQYQVVMIEDGTTITKEFNAVGREIPIEAKKVLNMPLLPLSDTDTLDVLYQSQHKPFFLITEDRATFSKVIALISNADKLRELEKLVNSDILINKRQVSQIKDQIIDYDGVIALREVYVEALADYKTIADDITKAYEEASLIALDIAKYKEILDCNKELVYLQKASSLDPLNLDIISKFQDSALKVASLHEQFNASILVIPESVEIPDFKPFDFDGFRVLFDQSVQLIPEEVTQVTFNTESIEELKRLSKDISTILPAEVEEYADYSQLLVEVKGSLLESIQISQDLDALHDIQNSINSELLQFEGQTCPICGSILYKEHLINA